MGQLGFKMSNHMEEQEDGLQVLDSDNKWIVLKPKHLNFHIQVRSMACGANHSHLLSSGGEVYSMGSNRYGQLGLGFDESSLKKVEYPTLIANLKATKIRCGDYHSLAIDDKGMAYGWGQLEHGAVGVRITAASEPGVIKFQELKPNSKIKDISAGRKHSCFLTDHGDAYSSGANAKGQLGIGCITDKEFRTIIVRLRDNFEQIT